MLDFDVVGRLHLVELDFELLRDQVQTVLAALLKFGNPDRRCVLDFEDPSGTFLTADRRP